MFRLGTIFSQEGFKNVVERNRFRVLEPTWKPLQGRMFINIVSFFFNDLKRNLIFAKNIIGANGNLNACACRDANFTLNVGNLNITKLEDILSKKNDKYMQLIKDQENGNFPEVCKTCDFYDSIYINKKITQNVKSLINKKDFFQNL